MTTPDPNRRRRRRKAIALLARLLGVSLLLALITGIAIRVLHRLPPLEPRTSSSYLTETSDTPLGRGVTAVAADNQDLSGVHMLRDGREAFAARILLTRAATRSLDIQYYIWHGDLSGVLMLEAVREAADRGVRVRMLLDDNGIAGLDPVLAALDHHPNIEIRLFNPFVLRKPKMLGYLADFWRLNRRMHNKSLTVDNQVTVIGGRNIGDEYFGAADEGLFVDLDVLAIGPIVSDVSKDFDRYWSSRSAYPAERILPAVSAEQLDRLATQASILERDPAARGYVDAVRSLPFIAQLITGSLPWQWAKVRMVSDDPAKGLGAARRDGMLTSALREAVGIPEQEIRLVSGYFVPTDAGVREFASLAKQGIDIAIFTNAFEATDVWVVHAGYAEHRKALLRSGVRLFEMRGPNRADGRPRRSLTATGSGSSAGAEGPVLRSSGSTLHAKTFAVDRKRVFVGSFNFDPRSMHLNTELGFVIESPVLAEGIEGAFNGRIPSEAYEVVLTDKGKLGWKESAAGEALLHETEPGTSRLQRWGIAILSFLPIDWLL